MGTKKYLADRKGEEQVDIYEQYWGKYKLITYSAIFTCSDCLKQVKSF